jgi:hypothetical protein
VLFRSRFYLLLAGGRLTDHDLQAL